MSSEEEHYTSCPYCERVFPKRYNYCPKCGERLFRLEEAPLLLFAGGLYFLNMILIIFLPPLLYFVALFEMVTAILLIKGRKTGGGFGILASVVNPIFLLYYLIVISFNYIAVLSIIVHLVGAYLIIREWEKLA